MYYISPYKIFNLPFGPISEEQVDQLIQQIRTETISHSAYDSITYNGNKLKVGDLRRLVQDLKDEDARAFHLQLFENKELLNYLEYGHLGYLENRNKETEDPKLMSFIAAHFAYSFSEALVQALKSGDKPAIEFLAAQDLPCLEEFEAEYFESAAEYINNSLNDLHGLKEDERLMSMSEREILSYLPEKMIDLFNLLPDFFFAARNYLAFELHDLALVLTNEFGRADGATALIKQGLKLKLEEEPRKALKDLLKQHQFNFGKLPVWLMIGLGVVALLFLLKWLENKFF